MNIQKSKLLKFVSKYYLNGTNESVKYAFSSTDSTLATTFFATDKTLLGTVTLSGFKADEDVNVGIYNTKQFVKILGPCDEEIDIDLVKSSDGKRVTAFTITDKSDKSITNFVTADMAAIQEVPPKKPLPPFTVELKISKAFAEKFISSRKALEGVGTVSFVPDKTSKIAVILGYSPKLNANNKRLVPEVVVGKDELPSELTFSADHIENILSANMDAFVKDDSRITFHIATAGMIKTDIDAGEYKSSYLVVVKK